MASGIIQSRINPALSLLTSGIRTTKNHHDHTVTCINPSSLPLTRGWSAPLRRRDWPCPNVQVTCWLSKLWFRSRPPPPHLPSPEPQAPSPESRVPSPPLRFDKRKRPGVPLLLLSCNIDSGWLVCHALGLILSIGQIAQTVNTYSSLCSIDG